MNSPKKNYALIHASGDARTELHDQLYGILSGAGEIWLDGEVIALRAGDWLRVAPAAKRAIRALPTEAMRFICIQTKCGSLEGFTMTDGIPCEEKAPWH